MSQKRNNKHRSTASKLRLPDLDLLLINQIFMEAGEPGKCSWTTRHKSGNITSPRLGISFWE
jgi:hypothetical protein